jgi:inner membrane protein
MGIHPQYWHWLVFGMILIIAELFIPSFTVFWFGLAGLIVGGVLLVSPGTGFTWQLFFWALGSCLMTFLWFKLFKPLVRFTTPLLGAEEWPFICQQTVAVGDRVAVNDISGNTLIVIKREKA